MLAKLQRTGVWRTALALALTWTLSLGAAAPAVADTAEPWPAVQKNPLVIELYTSQGCSSCPPADKMLHRLADHPGVLGLAFHVDYWDYIGWKDPFAHAHSTNRQKYYRHVLQNRYIYTPQFIVGGDWSPERGNTAMFDQDVIDKKSGHLMLTTDKNGIGVPSYDGLDGPADVWLMHFDRWHSTKITSGENAGHELGYRHVVREIKHLGDWRGEARTLRWPEKSRYGAALIIQDRAAGTILATLVTMN